MVHGRRGGGLSFFSTREVGRMGHWKAEKQEDEHREMHMWGITTGPLWRRTSELRNKDVQEVSQWVSSMEIVSVRVEERAVQAFRRHHLLRCWREQRLD